MENFFHKATTSVVFVAGTMALFGCTGSTIHTQSMLGDVDTLSLDAKQRLVISGMRTATKGEPAHRVICAEPSPDALVAQAAVLAAHGNYNGPTGQPTVSGGAGIAQQESAASLAMRTQSIQILRDGYYRLCETYLNGAIDKHQYAEVIYNLDTFINIALAIDGLGDSKSVPAVAIGTGDITINDPTNKDGTNATPSIVNIGATPQPKIDDQGGASKSSNDGSNAKTVAQIVRDYLKYKENYHCLVAQRQKCNSMPSASLGL